MLTDSNAIQVVANNNSRSDSNKHICCKEFFRNVILVPFYVQDVLCNKNAIKQPLVRNGNKKGGVEQKFFAVTIQIFLELDDSLSEIALTFTGIW